MKRFWVFAFFLLVISGWANFNKVIFLKNVRFYSYSDYTRVVLDLSAPITIKEKILPGKEKTRLYFDLVHSDLHRTYPREKNKEINVESGNLKRIRIGKRTRNSIRIVFDFDHIGKYHMFYLTAPYRIVFDIFQDNNGHSVISGKAGNTPTSIEGKYSVARQLGLGVHTIVIDPGHGGKDPGAINQRLQIYEKTLTLDLAKRLKLLLEKEKKFDVILTRSSDRYISLEERTAIANSKKGDIFISIHLNSAPRKKVRGVETYFLSMTTDPWAIRVAAQENAVSQKTIAEMKSILDRILKNTKISESKILSKLIQSNVVKNLRQKYRQVQDLGVKKAPFFVLVGARMPSILTEVSFLSNTQEGKRLKSSKYRERIVHGLYNGIMAYVKSLGKL